VPSPSLPTPRSAGNKGRPLPPGTLNVHLQLNCLMPTKSMGAWPWAAWQLSAQALQQRTGGPSTSGQQRRHAKASSVRSVCKRVHQRLWVVLPGQHLCSSLPPTHTRHTGAHKGVSDHLPQPAWTVHTTHTAVRGTAPVHQGTRGHLHQPPPPVILKSMPATSAPVGCGLGLVLPDCWTALLGLLPVYAARPRYRTFLARPPGLLNVHLMALPLGATPYPTKLQPSSASGWVGFFQQPQSADALHLCEHWWQGEEGTLKGVPLREIVTGGLN
jgi:hypothetical protein